MPIEHRALLAQRTPDGFGRRLLLGSALAAPAVLRGRAALAAGRPVRIGYVTPRTGPLAAFSEPDPFVLAQVQKAVGAGLIIGGALHPVQIIPKDSQSSTSRGSEVTGDLILRDKVDLILAASASDTTNPVADQAEVNGVPCITTDAPWQAYFFGRQGDPKKGFEWTYHFFWGLESAIAAYIDLWSGAPTNKVVGSLYPNDSDGNAWRDPQFGMAPALVKAGFKQVDTGSFQPLTSDFTSQIAAFKAAQVEILTGVLIPPDFATFWGQAAQQGFHPKIATIAKALLFPSAVNALGARGAGLSSEVWWSPHHPYKSGLTGQTAGELCAEYTQATGRQWTQPLGFRHAIFEVAFDVLKRAKTLDEPDDIRRAITETDYHSIVGPVNWHDGPVKNVSRTPLVAGQWHNHGAGLDLDVVNNTTAPEIPLSGSLSLLS